jgi:hypothetical protein
MDIAVRFNAMAKNLAGLIGGAEFEPREANLTIGFRIASRNHPPLSERLCA